MLLVLFYLSNFPMEYFYFYLSKILIGYFYFYSSILSQYFEQVCLHRCKSTRNSQ